MVARKHYWIPKIYEKISLIFHNPITLKVSKNAKYPTRLCGEDVIKVNELHDILLGVV